MIRRNARYESQRNGKEVSWWQPRGNQLLCPQQFANGIYMHFHIRVIKLTFKGWGHQLFWAIILLSAFVAGGFMPSALIIRNCWGHNSWFPQSMEQSRNALNCKLHNLNYIILNIRYSQTVLCNKINIVVRGAAPKSNGALPPNPPLHWGLDPTPPLGWPVNILTNCVEL